MVVGGFIGQEFVKFLEVVDFEAEKPLDYLTVLELRADNVGGGTRGGMCLSKLGESNQLGKEGQVSSEVQVVEAVGQGFEGVERIDLVHKL